MGIDGVFWQPGEKDGVENWMALARVTIREAARGVSESANIYV
jgi:hypothetical protein